MAEKPKTTKLPTTKEIVVESPVVKVSAETITVSGGIMKDKLIPVLVVLVIVSAFVVGLLYGKLSIYEKGTVAGSQTAGAQANAGAATPAPAQPTEEPVLSDDQWQTLLTGDGRVEGQDSAPVTMVEFTDFECPFCEQYYTNTYSQIKKNYIDTGKVRYIVYDMPLPFHPNAKPGALAARCAEEQGKFFDMHNQLFTNQNDWINGDPTEKFSGYAKDIGLNVTQFNSCYSSGKYNSAIDDNVTLAGTVQVSGTPTFFINKQRVVGAQPTATFTSMLDQALKG